MIKQSWVESMFPEYNIASYMRVVRPGLPEPRPWNGVETWKEKTPARRRGKTLLKALGIVSF